MTVEIKDRYIRLDLEPGAATELKIGLDRLAAVPSYTLLG